MLAAISKIVQSSRIPFQVRSFRYQWPADLCASWAFEMEILVLGWYVLVESNSVLMLVVYGALQYSGSLISPFFGIAGDRFGYRSLFMLTRGLYGCLALLIALLGLFDLLSPVLVIVLASIVGVVRPSDMMMRYALIGQTQPADQMTAALGLSRMTSDSARIAGALAGASVFAQFGLVPAYVVITVLYIVSFIFSRGVAGRVPHVGQPVSMAPVRDLKEAFVYAWGKPELLGPIAIAFLINLLAFPFSLGLLPYIARTIYEVDQTGLGLLSASFSVGALVGSLVLGTNVFSLGTARAMFISTVCWFGLLLVFAPLTSFVAGAVILLCAGFAQSMCMTPLAAVMLRSTDAKFRGRLMGLRVLAIWGLPLGLLISGPLISSIGFVATTVLYTTLGILATVTVAWKWRERLWQADAPANRHG
jgi:predicted MFS family arabinose efflux permease